MNLEELSVWGKKYTRVTMDSSSTIYLYYMIFSTSEQQGAQRTSQWKIRKYFIQGDCVKDEIANTY